MSTLQWDGHRLIQSVGSKNARAELGYVSYDKHSKKYVLWLKDLAGDFIGNPGQYVRGDSWDTMEEALEKAANCPSAFLFHLKWMHSLDVAFCFMAMEFGNKQLEEIVAEHIKPAIRKSFNVEVNTARDVAQAGLIDEIIRDQIRRAKFVLADLTHGNNGAYWEAGFAEGFGVPVIYICEERVFDRESTHFDTNHLTTVMWSIDQIETFKDNLIAAVSNTLKQKPIV